MTDPQPKRFSLRGGALQVLRDRSDEVLIAGPAGTGKSFACLLKVHLMCLKNPGMRALVVRKTHRSLSSTGLVTLREHVAPEAIRTGLMRWYGGSGEKPAQYQYQNGSVIVVGGMDNADKVMSAEYDVAYVQEATELTRDDWEKITSRLRNGKVSFQQIIADCNPQQPTHWLKKRCDEGRTQMIYGKHQDNPRLYTDDNVVTDVGKAYLSKLDGLSGVRKLRLRDGKWAAAEGVIYGGWDPQVHIDNRKSLPWHWRRIWSVDFGFVHPFVWQQWAIDEDGRMYLEREIYRSKRLVEDHCRDILRLMTESLPIGSAPKGRPAGADWNYPRPSVIVCDHDAEDRATFERHIKMGTTPATKTVSDGIQAVQKRLEIQPDARPRLYVLRESLVERDEDLFESGMPTCFAEEIEGYVWKPRPQAVLGREKPLPDEPEKLYDDSMDAARYAVAYQDLKSGYRVRWM